MASANGDSGIATRLAWMVFAPFEFVVTVLVGLFLYLGLAAFIYLSALRGLFERATTVAMLRFRVGAIVNSASESTPATAPPLSGALARGPVGRGRFFSWLN